MKSKNGVEYNLDETPYVCSWREFDFYFSSATHLEKFNAKIDIRVPWLNDSMSRRFHVDISVDLLAVLQLYMQVETRGFRICDTFTGEVYRCRENITLHGLGIKGRNLTAPSENITTQ